MVNVKMEEVLALLSLLWNFVSSKKNLDKNHD